MTPGPTLRAYDADLLAGLLASRDAVRAGEAGPGALRERITRAGGRDTPWRKAARAQLDRLVTFCTSEALLRAQRLVADPRAALVASIDEGALPDDEELAILAEVARQPLTCSVPRILFAVDAEQRRGEPAPPGEWRLRRGTEAYHRLVGSRPPAVGDHPLAFMEVGAAFAPTTFHDREDVALAASFFGAVTSRPAPTPEEIVRAGFRVDDGDLPGDPRDPTLGWRVAGFLAEVARVAASLARFHARCARSGWVVWVDVDEGAPDELDER